MSSPHGCNESAEGGNGNVWLGSTSDDRLSLPQISRVLPLVPLVALPVSLVLRWRKTPGQAGRAGFREMGCSQADGLTVRARVRQMSVGSGRHGQGQADRVLAASFFPPILSFCCFFKVFILFSPLPSAKCLAFSPWQALPVSWC